MKKLLALILLLVMIAPISLADTITIDFDKASAEELKIVRDAIDAKLKEIRLANTAKTEDKYTLTGKGTQILEGIDLSFLPARFFVKSTKEVKVTLCTENGNRSYDGSNSSSYQFAFLISKPQAISTIMVETQGEWVIEFSPIILKEQVNASGSGSYVTDSFQVSAPSIITISFNHGKYYGYTYIDLYKIRSDGSILTEEWMWQDIVSDDEKFDYIIKHEDNIDSYFLRICCPHDTKWSVTTK